MPKYVAYCGNFINDGNQGIRIYDVDMVTGVFTFRSEVEAHNPIYLTVSKDKKFLYSIVEEGVSAFSINDDGSLNFLNTKWIGGLRGCYLTVDSENRYIFIGGYYDGRITMINLLEDGSIGDVTCGIFHQGLGISSVEARLEPKVTCVELSHDEKLLYTVDYGIDQVVVYSINYTIGKLDVADIIRCPFGTMPRMVRLTKDDKYVYILSEKRNKIDVMKADRENGKLSHDKIQSVSVIKDTYMTAAAAALEISRDEEYVYASVDAVNSFACLKRDARTGELRFEFDFRVSGDCPGSIYIFPDKKHVVSLNYDTNEMRTFEMHYKHKYALMRKPPLKIKKPTCLKIMKLKEGDSAK